MWLLGAKQHSGQSTDVNTAVRIHWKAAEQMMADPDDFLAEMKAGAPNLHNLQSPPRTSDKELEQIWSWKSLRCSNEAYNPYAIPAYVHQSFEHTLTLCLGLHCGPLGWDALCIL